MFNLTRYKYIFFAISGIIIVPGLLAMFIWGLNPGIDFTNGASVDLRFQAPSTGAHAVTIQGVANVFQSAGAKDVQVLLASPDQSGTVPANQYVFIKFSRPIGTSEVGSVLQKLQDPKVGLPALVQANNQPLYHVLYIVTLPNADKMNYGMMAVAFTKPVDTKVVQKALADLPPTDAPPVTPQGTLPSATPSAAATTGATPAATATPNAKATATPKATATATPATSQTFPVSVTDVQIGQNNQIYTVETQTDLTAPGKMDAILARLQEKFGFGVYVEASSEVGPAIASETTRNAIFAVLAASAFILLYITFAFRKVGSWRLSFRFGTCAIIALLHDALVVLGLWAIFGKAFDFKVDTLFLTAVLTVIGFSVHDTIVVFDRIRENLSRRTAETFEQVVNASLVQTMSRSLNTSLTVLFTLSALTLFGGASIRSFTLALLIGIASGTYSSIFNASMLLVVWETGEWRQWPIVRSFVKPEEDPVPYRRSLARAGSR